MNKIQATIVADSRNTFGQRITTMLLTYPRIIHAELMTHRVFSRNAASSRAIPSAKLIESVEKDPFIPIAFQRQHKGMQGAEYITDPVEIQREIDDWLDDRDYAVKKAKSRLARGVTKQLINRPLEPFQYYQVLVTGTEWSNFFELRSPQYELHMKEPGVIYKSRKDLTAVHPPYSRNTELEWLSLNKGQAEIHMMGLAEAMWDAYHSSTPKHLQPGEWHIPFGDNFDEEEIYNLAYPLHIQEKITELQATEKIRLKIAVARCARLSYLTLGDNPKIDYEADIKLHDILMSSGHMSTFEHVARAMSEEEMEQYCVSTPRLDSEGKPMKWFITKEEGWCGNFRGFVQYRKLIPNENR